MASILPKVIIDAITTSVTETVVDSMLKYVSIFLLLILDAALISKEYFGERHVTCVMDLHLANTSATRSSPHESALIQYAANYCKLSKSSLRTYYPLILALQIIVLYAPHAIWSLTQSSYINSIYDHLVKHVETLEKQIHEQSVLKKPLIYNPIANFIALCKKCDAEMDSIQNKYNQSQTIAVKELTRLREEILQAAEQLQNYILDLNEHIQTNFLVTQNTDVEKLREIMDKLLAITVHNFSNKDLAKQNVEPLVNGIKKKYKSYVFRLIVRCQEECNKKKSAQKESKDGDEIFKKMDILLHLIKDNAETARQEGTISQQGREEKHYDRIIAELFRLLEHNDDDDENIEKIKRDTLLDYVNSTFLDGIKKEQREERNTIWRIAKRKIQKRNMILRHIVKVASVVAIALTFPLCLLYTIINAESSSYRCDLSSVNATWATCTDAGLEYMNLMRYVHMGFSFALAAFAAVCFICEHCCIRCQYCQNSKLFAIIESSCEERNDVRNEEEERIHSKAIKNYEILAKIFKRNKEFVHLVQLFQELENLEGPSVSNASTQLAQHQDNLVLNGPPQRPSTRQPNDESTDPGPSDRLIATTTEENDTQL